MSIVIALVIVLIVGGLIVRFYPHPKKELEIKSQVLPTPSFQPTTSSIHEEIAKTIEDIKTQSPIEEPTKKITKKSPSKATKKVSKIDTKKKSVKKTTKK